MLLLSVPPSTGRIASDSLYPSPLWPPIHQPQRSLSFKISPALPFSCSVPMPTCQEPARESPPIKRLCGRVLVGKASQNSRGAPLGLPERLPQNQSLSVLLLHDFHQLLWQSRGAIPGHVFSEENQLRALAISLLGIIGVFQSKPLRWLSNLPDRFTRTPTATHTIVYSLPTTRGMGSLRYSNNVGELETVKTSRRSLLSQCLLPSFHIPCIVSLEVY